MALIDNVYKVIYWDEVNWQWLPFVRIKDGKLKVKDFNQGITTYKSVHSREEIINLLSEEGYLFSSLSSLGVTEISKGCYLYKGTIYRNIEGGFLKNFPQFLSMVTGWSLGYVSKQLKGSGVVSKQWVKELKSKKFKIEFRGNVYNSYSELSEAYGFSNAYLHSKLAKGFSLEQVVAKYKSPRIPMKDHLGNKFSSVNEMAKHWGISYSAYKKRLDEGWSLEKILTTPVKKETFKECVDFKGNVFPSMKSMAKSYRVPYSTLCLRVSRGMTPAEALEYLLSQEKGKQEVTDHLGNSFSSYSKMAEFYKIPSGTLSTRLKRGWSLEEALTGKRG